MVRPSGASSADALVDSLGHRFADPSLLREALTHPSVQVTERGAARFGYERLEFLGDRVLGLLIAEWLIERFPAEPEGALARRLTALVRAETLGEVGRSLELGHHLLMSPAEAGAGGRDNVATVADACEAVIGALYLDGGLDAARRFIEAHWTATLEATSAPPQDAKTTLQEWAQGRGLALPEYREIAREGPPHQPLFTVQVTVGDFAPVAGQGRSKRLAEQRAAGALLERLAAGAS